MVISLFAESIGYMNEKWRHSDVFTIRVSEKNDSVHTGPCTDTDTRKQMHGHWLV